MDDHRADGLISSAVGHVDTDAAVVDCNGLEIPQPVPVHEDGGLDVVEGQVTGGELLVTQKGPVMAAVEDQVCHPASGAVVHENAELLVVVAAFDHLEADVLQTSSLSDLPMDPGTCRSRKACQVNDEVSDLTEEVVLVGVPICPGIGIRVGVNNCDAYKIGSSFEDGQADGISDELRVVQLNNRLADNVGTGRKVDDGWGDGGGVTS